MLLKKRPHVLHVKVSVITSYSIHYTKLYEQETVKKFDGVDVNKLKDDLATLQTKYDTDLKDAKLNFAIETKLTKEGAVNTKAVRALLDSSKISLDGDNLIGLDEQLKTLKESEKWAFSGTQTKDVPGGGGNPPTGTETKTPLPSGIV